MCKNVLFYLFRDWFVFVSQWTRLSFHYLLITTHSKDDFKLARAMHVYIHYAQLNMYCTYCRQLDLNKANCMMQSFVEFVRYSFPIGARLSVEPNRVQPDRFSSFVRLFHPFRYKNVHRTDRCRATFSKWKFDPILCHLPIAVGSICICEHKYTVNNLPNPSQNGIHLNCLNYAKSFFSGTLQAQLVSHDTQN